MKKTHEQLENRRTHYCDHLSQWAEWDFDEEKGETKAISCPCDKGCITCGADNAYCCVTKKGNRADTFHKSRLDSGFVLGDKGEGMQLTDAQKQYKDAYPCGHLTNWAMWEELEDPVIEEDELISCPCDNKCETCGAEPKHLCVTDEGKRAHKLHRSRIRSYVKNRS